MEFFKDLSKTRYIIGLIIVLAVFFAFATSVEFRSYTVVRGGHEEVSWLNNNSVIKQEYPYGNLKKLKLDIIKNEEKLLNNDGIIEFEFRQDNKTKTAKIDINMLENGWQNVVVNLDCSDFSDDNAILTVSYKGSNSENVIGLLFTSGNQAFSMSNVVIDGNVKDGMFLSSSYNLSIYKILICSFGVFFAFFSLIFFILKTLLKYNKKNVYNPVLCFFLFFMLVQYLKSGVWAKSLNQWCTTPFLVNYNDGFISKALMGSICSIFTNFFTYKTFQIVFHVIFIVFILAIYFVVKSFINNSQSTQEKEIISTVFLVYILSPFGPAGYLYNWLRLDVVLCFLFLITIFCLTKHNTFFTFLTIILSILAILTHQYFVFCMYPAIIGIFLYKIVVKKNKEVLWPMILNVILSAASAFYLQFFGKVNYTFSEYMKIVSARSEIEPLAMMVEVDNYYSTKEIWEASIGILIRGNTLLHFVVVVLLLMPIFIFLFKFWRASIKQQVQTQDKIVTCILALVPLASLPVFVVGADWGRFFSMLVFEEVFLVIALVKVDYSVFGKSFSCLCDLNNRKTIYSVLFICAYLILLGKWSDNMQLDATVPVVNGIIHLFRNLIFL